MEELVIVFLFYQAVILLHCYFAKYIIPPKIKTQHP